MRLYKESKRLKDTQVALRSTHLHFGPNKKQELIRLIYETSKINNISPRGLLRNALSNNNFQNTKQAFANLKGYFLEKRFPTAYRDEENFNSYLPKISLNSRYSVLKRDRYSFYPKKIFIEKDAKDYTLAKSIVNKFPKAKIVNIGSFKDHTKSIDNKTAINNYNERTKNLFLVKERYDFIKPCPCSKGVLRCGYYVMNLGFGCPYECSYCFLQGYTNVKGIVIPVNIDSFLAKLELFLRNHKGRLRIGTGEFTDSLALDNLTGFSEVLIDFFSRQKNATFELKTKSNNIKNILNLNHNKKTVISWSLNPQPIVDSDEWQTNNLLERIDAAKECCDAGYLVGFHFDPIIYSTNWDSSYRDVIDELFKRISYKNIAWISLGTLRFAPKLKTIIEQRFPKSKILDEELIIDFDKKLRYSQKQRIEIYKRMFYWIRKYSSDVLVYLCMEPKEVWEATLGRRVFCFS
ncbi:radical SAM protein [Candidatus Omnitrophota bacterium]